MKLALSTDSQNRLNVLVSDGMKAQVSDLNRALEALHTLGVPLQVTACADVTGKQWITLDIKK